MPPTCSSLPSEKVPYMAADVAAAANSMLPEPKYLRTADIVVMAVGFQIPRAAHSQKGCNVMGVLLAPQSCAIASAARTQSQVQLMHRTLDA